MNRQRFVSKVFNTSRLTKQLDFLDSRVYSLLYRLDGIVKIEEDDETS
jgi:hypothetical protein